MTRRCQYYKIASNSAFNSGCTSMINKKIGM